MATKKIVLLELGGSHTECLYAQILFLQQAQYEVHIICNRELWPMLEWVPGIAGHQLHDLSSGLISHLTATRRIRQYLRLHGIRKMVINTVETSMARDLALTMLFRKTEIIGVLHNGRKLNAGFNLRRLTALKIKKFFVLNNSMLAHIQPPPGITVRSFYAAFFPDMRPVPLEKPAGECWVCIPGGIIPSRRDYAGLVEQIKSAGLPPRMKIILLGGFQSARYPELAAAIEALPQRDQVVLFPPGPVPQELFHAYLQQSDVILPLLHEGNDMFAEYSATRISGAYNLAFAYRIPLVMEESFRSWEDFRKHAFFYKVPGLLSTLQQLADDPAALQRKSEGMREDPVLQFETQCKAYLELVEL